MMSGLVYEAMAERANAVRLIVMSVSSFVVDKDRRVPPTWGSA
jgi:hypothetical protein